MRRLLSPAACWSYTPPDGGGSRHGDRRAPRRFFGFSPLPDPWGWGVAAVPPQPAFSEVNQDDNHSWYANKN